MNREKLHKEIENSFILFDKRLNGESINETILMQELFSLLLNKIPPVDMIKNYYETEDVSLQDFCSKNTICEWNTGVGIIEAVESMLKEAISKGNIN